MSLHLLRAFLLHLVSQLLYFCKTEKNISTNGTVKAEILHTNKRSCCSFVLGLTLSENKYFYWGCMWITYDPRQQLRTCLFPVLKVPDDNLAVHESANENAVFSRMPAEYGHIIRTPVSGVSVPEISRISPMPAKNMPAKNVPSRQAA